MGPSAHTTALLLGLAALLAAPAKATADEHATHPRVNDLYGSALAINGDQLLVGAAGDNDRAFNGGAVYVYDRSADAHTLKRKLFPIDLAGQEKSGRALAIDGDTLVVGGFSDDFNDPETAPRPRTVAIFRRSDNGWYHEATLAHDDPAVVADRFGRAVAIVGDRTAITAGMVQIGDTFVPARVDIFDREGGSWEHSARLHPDPDTFEIRSVALVGDHLLVRASGLQAYTLLDTTWVEEKLPTEAVDGSVDAFLAIPGEALRVAIARDQSLMILRHEGSWMIEGTLPLPTRVATDRAPLAFAAGQLTALCRIDVPMRLEQIVTFREDEGAWRAFGEPLVLTDFSLRSPTIAADREHLYIGLPYDTVGDSEVSQGTVQVFKAGAQGWSFDQELLPAADPGQTDGGCTIAPQSRSGSRGALFFALIIPAFAARRRRIQR